MDVVEPENDGTSNEFSVAEAVALTSNGNAKGKIGGGVNEETKILAFFANASQVFNLEELLRASAEVLGKGTFGTTYKAVLEVGNVVAVKRLKDVTISERQFREKIEGVGKLGCSIIKNSSPSSSTSLTTFCSAVGSGTVS